MSGPAKVVLKIISLIKYAIITGACFSRKSVINVYCGYKLFCEILISVNNVERERERERERESERKGVRLEF